MNPLDEITLTGLRATAFHGVLDHERRDGQVFVIDVTVMLPLGDAATTDDLARTIHPHPTLSETLAEAADLHNGLCSHLYRPARKGTPPSSTEN